MKIRLAYPSASSKRNRPAVAHVEVDALVDALVFGCWAAHETQYGVDGWSVSHVASGLSLCNSLTRDEAVHVAIRMARFIPRMPRITAAMANQGRRVTIPDMRGLTDAAIGEVLGEVDWYP